MSPIVSFVHLLAASRRRRREQWLTPGELGLRRRARLRRVAALAAATPHYRAVFAAAGADPAELTEATLPQLPLLDKSVIHSAEPTWMLTEPIEGLSMVTTSGSTGTPLRAYRSARDQAEVSAVWSRALTAFGHRVFDRQVNIATGGAVAKSGPVVLLRKLGLLPSIRQMSSFAHPDEHIEVLRRERPHTFSSYAISLELVAERILERGITDIKPAVVFSAAMALSDRGRDLAERAFGVRPLDLYVSSELGVIGWECPANRGALHLNDDVQIVEILDPDGRAVPPGEVGEVVVTQLHTTAQPLIRYRLGDLAARLPGRCPCGRGLALLSPVQGRTRHVIRLPDGRALTSMQISKVVRQFPEVRRWQLRQLGPTDLRLLVVTTDAWRTAQAPEIARTLEEHCGSALRFQVMRTDDIPLAPTGKFQTVVPLDIPEEPQGSGRSLGGP